VVVAFNTLFPVASVYARVHTLGLVTEVWLPFVSVAVEALWARRYPLNMSPCIGPEFSTVPDGVVTVTVSV